MSAGMLIPYLIPLLFIALMIAAVVSSSKKAGSEGIPCMQIWARVIRITRMPAPNPGNACIITFEDAASQRFTMTVPAEICNSFTEGCTGSLCYQGRIFYSFTPLSEQQPY